MEGMRVGGKRKILVPPELGWSSSGGACCVLHVYMCKDGGGLPVGYDSCLVG